MILSKIKTQASRFIILVIYAFAAINLQSCISNEDEKIYSSHPDIMSNYLPNYYESLFKPEIKDKLKFLTSIERKYKDTVSNFLYDGKWFIQIYKLSGQYGQSLKSSIVYDDNVAEQEVGTIFYGNQVSKIGIYDKMAISKKDIPGNILISMYGSNIKVVANTDSLVNYSFTLKFLSIKYGISGGQEMFANVYHSDDTIPCQIMFLKKGHNLYLLFMSPKKADLSNHDLIDFIGH